MHEQMSSIPFHSLSLIQSCVRSSVRLLLDSKWFIASYVVSYCFISTSKIGQDHINNELCHNKSREIMQSFTKCYLIYGALGESVWVLVGWQEGRQVGRKVGSKQKQLWIGWLRARNLYSLVGCCRIECLEGNERKTVKVIYCSRGLESSSCWFSSLLKN